VVSLFLVLSMTVLLVGCAYGGAIVVCAWLMSTVPAQPRRLALCASQVYLHRVLRRVRAQAPHG
jgi:hypothetical protein